MCKRDFIKNLQEVCQCDQLCVCVCVYVCEDKSLVINFQQWLQGEDINTGLIMTNLLLIAISYNTMALMQLICLNEVSCDGFFLAAGGDPPFAHQSLCRCSSFMG